MSSHTTSIATTNDLDLTVTLDETAGTITFTDDDGRDIAAYTTTTFADITTALALDVIAGIVIDDETVAGIQQWARI